MHRPRRKRKVEDTRKTDRKIRSASSAQPSRFAWIGGRCVRAPVPEGKSRRIPDPLTSPQPRSPRACHARNATRSFARNASFWTNVLSLGKGVTIDRGCGPTESSTFVPVALIINRSSPPKVERVTRGADKSREARWLRAADRPTISQLDLSYATADPARLSSGKSLLRCVSR